MAQKENFSIRLMLDTLTVRLLLLHCVVTKQVVSVVVVEGGGMCTCLPDDRPSDHSLTEHWPSMSKVLNSSLRAAKLSK